MLGVGGDAGDLLFVQHYYIDDSILVEVRFYRDGPCLQRAIESIASDHVRLLFILGLRGPSDLPLTHKTSFCAETLVWMC